MPENTKYSFTMLPKIIFINLSLDQNLKDNTCIIRHFVDGKSPI